MSQTRNSRLPAARAEEAGWEKLALAFSPRCLICQAQIVAARRACKSEGGALAIPTSDVAVLWDYVSLVTEKAVERISHMGGLKPIAISHPRYYSALAEQSESFDGAPVYLHEDDRQWVMRPHESIRFWSGETLIRTGGHFEGSTVLHHAGGADGRGDLFVGDNLQVTADRRFVSFMRSYPNYIPLNRKAVERIVAAVEPYPYERVFSAFTHRNIMQDGKAAMSRSIERYLATIRD